MIDHGSDAPEVSVVIPTYNRAPLLKRALESVVAQAYERWEAVVVDDYSDDDTERVVAAFRDPRIRLVRFKSAGVIAASRNEGIRVSRGRYVAFLDSDDAWYPLKLARCLALMRDEVDLVAHGLDYIRDGKFWKRKRCGPKDWATYERLLYSGNCLTTSAVIVRKSCLERVRGFIEDPKELLRDLHLGRMSEQGPVHVGSEDYDLWLRLVREGTRVEIIDEMLGEYHVHGNNATKAARCLIDSQLAVLSRHFGSWNNISLWEWVRRRRRQAMVFYATARSLQDDGEMVCALRLYWEGLRLSPFVFKLYPAALLAVCGWPRH